MFGVFGGGDAPKIVKFGAVLLGIENHLDENDAAGGEFAVFKVGGGVGVVAGVAVVVDEGGGDGDALSCSCSDRVRRALLICGDSQVGDVKGGKTGFELVFEVGFILGGKIVDFAEVFEEVGKDGDLFGILSGAKGNAFFLVIAPVASLAGLHIGEEGICGGVEIKNPSVGGVEIVGFFDGVAEFLGDFGHFWRF